MTVIAPDSSARSHLAAWLDRVPWAYETARFRGLGYDFSVRVMDGELGRFLDQAWAPSAVPGASSHRYSLVDRGPGRRRRFSLYAGDARVVRTERPSQALGMLCWHINRQVVATRGDHLVLHAAGAEHQGQALVIAAPMESGKTTLIAGLVRAGLRYLTDEAIAIDPSTLRVTPYLKPLSIDPGSWPVLASMRPRVSDEVEPYLGAQWQVPATSIRPGAVGSSCPPAWIVLTSYRPDEPTSITPISPSDAAVALAQNTFGFETDPRRHLGLIAAVVGQCQRHRLVVSDLDRACELLLELLEES